MDDREAIAQLLGLWLAQPSSATIDALALVNRANVERVKRGLAPTPPPRLRVIVNFVELPEFLC